MGIECFPIPTTCFGSDCSTKKKFLVEYNLSDLSKESNHKDDGWFSGEFPTYSETTDKSPIEDQRAMKKDTIVQKEKPVFVESLLIQENKNLYLLLVALLVYLMGQNLHH